MARVVLENVRVDFPIYATQRSLRSVLFNRATGGLIQRQGKKQDRVVVRALSDVSMTLEDGDRLGLIGHNGSGKSTLLKVLAGIYEPIEGRLLVEGVVTPLFDDAGLDTEDSGYQNIFTAGLLLGMSREEIESRIADRGAERAWRVSVSAGAYLFGRNEHAARFLNGDQPRARHPADGRRHSRRRCAICRTSGAAAERFHRAKPHHGGGQSFRQMIRAMCNKAAPMQAGRIIALGSVDEIGDQYEAMVFGASAKKVAGLSKGSELELEAELEPETGPDPEVSVLTPV